MPDNKSIRKEFRESESYQKAQDLRPAADDTAGPAPQLFKAATQTSGSSSDSSTSSSDQSGSNTDSSGDKQ